MRATYRGAETCQASAGYVFPLALWALAIMAVLLAAAYSTLSLTNAGFQRLLARDQALSDLKQAEVRMLALLLTEPMGSTGIQVGGRLNLDPVSGGFAEGGDLIAAYGEPYRVDGQTGQVVVRLVALTGLINLSGEPEAAALALLTNTGVSRSNARRLAARLGDFVDEDDLRRLGGAEIREYPDDARPRNSPLALASEACGALGWADEVQFCSDPRLLDLVASAGSSEAMSARLSPQYLIEWLSGEGGRPAPARLILQDRARLIRFSDLGLEDLDDLEGGSTIPGPGFLIITHRPAAELIHVTRIDLTVQSLYKPYEVVFSYTMGGDEIQAAFHVDDINSVEGLPEAS